MTTLDFQRIVLFHLVQGMIVLFEKLEDSAVYILSNVKIHS